MSGKGAEHALFPISLSNQEFTTDVVLPLLPELFNRHQSITFLVADHLQIYNKALRISEGVLLKEIIDDFSAGRRYLEQRSRWIARTIDNMGVAIDDGRWRVIGVDDIADADCFRIFRNVMLAYYALPTFRHEVDHAADLHAVVRRDSFPLEQRRLLSRGYLLEEIAVSVRLHIIEGIRDEYYIGAQSAAVLGVYDGRYGFTAYDLAEQSDHGARDRFYELQECEAGPGWVIIDSMPPDPVIDAASARAGPG